MKRALMTPWMRECSECVLLVEALNETERGLKLLVLRAFEEVRNHLLAEHVDLLPEFADDCANCREWKAMEGALLSAGAAMVVSREALLHRAGHLLYDVEV